VSDHALPETHGSPSHLCVLCVSAVKSEGGRAKEARGSPGAPPCCIGVVVHDVPTDLHHQNEHRTGITIC
jgi:hypothetical protein